MLLIYELNLFWFTDISFFQFKSSGSERIVLTILQRKLEKLMKHLVRIIRFCSFISKSGRMDQTISISLTLFQLKTMQRICFWQLRDYIVFNRPKHSEQHAYILSGSRLPLNSVTQIRFEKKNHNKMLSTGRCLCHDCYVSLY